MKTSSKTKSGGYFLSAANGTRFSIRESHRTHEDSGQKPSSSKRMGLVRINRDIYAVLFFIEEGVRLVASD